MHLTNDQVQKILQTETGQLWEKYNKRRIYIQIEKALGMDVYYYNTGNISSASINGRGISNTKAEKILTGKCYIDLNDENKIVFCKFASVEMIEMIDNYLTNL